MVNAPSVANVSFKPYWFLLRMRKPCALPSNLVRSVHSVSLILSFNDKPVLLCAKKSEIASSPAWPNGGLPKSCVVSEVAATTARNQKAKIFCQFRMALDDHFTNAFSQRSSYTGNFQAVCKARVQSRAQERVHLCFVLQLAKGVRENDAIVILFESAWSSGRSRLLWPLRCDDRRVFQFMPQINQCG